MTKPTSSGLRSRCRSQYVKDRFEYSLADVNRQFMKLLETTERRTLVIDVVLLHLSTNPTETTEPDSLISNIETVEGVIGVQAMD